MIVFNEKTDYIKYKQKFLTKKKKLLEILSLPFGRGKIFLNFCGDEIEEDFDFFHEIKIYFNFSEGKFIIKNFSIDKIHNLNKSDIVFLKLNFRELNNFDQYFLEKILFFKKKKNIILSRFFPHLFFSNEKNKIKFSKNNQKKFSFQSSIFKERYFFFLKVIKTSIFRINLGPEFRFSKKN